ncbi:MAG: LamG-like jellyroll fold domain-containing protein, partial [Limisphaerales bacterium]
LTVAQAILEHRYSFVSDASDSVGGPKWNGALVPPGSSGTAAIIGDGLTLPGGGGPGYSGYVSLPSGILTNTTSLTVECWVTQSAQNTWAELWNFNNGTGQYIGYIPYPANNNNNMSMAIKNGTEYDALSNLQFPNGSEQYVVATFNSQTLTGSLYDGGSFLASVKVPDNTYIPGSYDTANNYLGQDPWPDPQFQGTIYEFRIWDGAVTPLYLAVAAAAGPSVVVTNLTPTAIELTVTNDTMVQGQSQPVTVTGNFTEASGIVVTSAATNWVSSDSSVLTVNSNGIVTAVATGSATISAAVNGTTGTSSTITVPSSAPIITQQPEPSDTFLQGATLTASVSVVGTTPFVYRWFFNDGSTPISTSSNPTLTIPDAQSGNAGTYAVLVSNVDGSILSSDLTVSVVSPSPYEQTVMQYDPVAYWPLQETSGTIAYDVVGGDNGTYTNFPSITGSSVTLGQGGPPQTFFGSSSYAAQFLSAIADIPVGQLNITGPITVTTWIQLLVTPTFDGIVGHGDQSWRLSVNPSGQPGANDGAAPADATDPIASPGIFDNNWHMITYSYTGNTSQANNGSLYVDGVLVANNSVAVTPTGDNLDVWIGGSPDYGTARLLPAANIAHVAIFNQAFTAAQAAGLYNGTFVLGPQTLHITQSGPNVVLDWQTGTLLESTNVLGPWTTNSAATPPYTLPASGNEQFFRLLVQ